MSNTGVYSITNLTNNKIYIGSVSSKKGFNGRWSRHIFDLKNNKHHSKHLQLSWNKYGVNNFEFKIIEIIEDVNLILIKEQIYLDLYQSYIPKNGYNILSKSNSSIGFKHTTESKNKMSNSHKNKKLKNTHKQKISESNKGKKHSIETKIKMSKWQLGKILSDETKSKISKSLIGLLCGEKNGNSKLSNDDRLTIINKYNSGDITRKQLSIEYKVSKSTIDNILIKKNK
jgi:group I intron endonuclease